MQVIGYYYFLAYENIRCKQITLGRPHFQVIKSLPSGVNLYKQYGKQYLLKLSH